MKLSILILSPNLRLNVPSYLLKDLHFLPRVPLHPGHFIFLISQPTKQIAQFLP